MNQAPNQLISNFCPEAENGDRPGFSFNGKMLKIGWTTGYAYLSCSIVALNLERSRVTLAPSVHLPRPPSLHLEGTNDASFTRAIPRTPRVARSLFEVEALTGLRHQLHLPVCTCVSRVTSKCDRPTRRVCLIHEWNDVGRDSIGGKVIESQKSRGKKFCNCDDDCGEVLRCDWGGGKRTLLTWNNGV